MYEEFYGLRDKPFSLTPDTSCLFLGSYHREALQFLTEGTAAGNAFLALTGDVGAGKTVVLRSFVKGLGDEFAVIQVFYPSGDVKELFQMILSETGLSCRETDISDLRKELQDRLDMIGRAKKTPLVVIDEAQNLGTDALREMLLLFGGAAAAPRARIVLCGQPPLRDILLSLNAGGRVSIPAYHLQSLPHSAIPDYICYRLAAAGCRDNALFPDDVIAEISRLSRGVPRLINTMCDALLAQGYLSGEKSITLSLLHSFPLSMSCNASAAQVHGGHAADPGSPTDNRLPMTVLILEKNRRSLIHVETRLLKHGFSCTSADSLEDLFSQLAEGEGKSLMVPVIDAAFLFSEGRYEEDDGTGSLDRLLAEYAGSPVIVTSVLTLTSVRMQLFRRGIPYFLEKPDVNTLSLSDIDESFDAFFVELQGCLGRIHRQFSAFYRAWITSAREKSDRGTSTADMPVETPL